MITLRQVTTPLALALFAAVMIGCQEEWHGAHSPIETSLEAPETVNVGESFGVVLTVHNTSEDDLAGVVIHQHLPEGVETEKGLTAYRVTVGELAAGARKAFRVKLQAVAPGDYTLVAVAQGEGTPEGPSEPVLLVANEG